MYILMFCVGYICGTLIVSKGFYPLVSFRSVTENAGKPESNGKKRDFIIDPKLNRFHIGNNLN